MCDLSRIEKLINQVESGHESINIKLSSLSIRWCQLIHNVEIRELISEGAFLQLSHQANTVVINPRLSDLKGPGTSNLDWRYLDHNKIDKTVLVGKKNKIK